jgi:hypothetical protein
MDHSFSRHANSAGLALPRIPRRTSSSSGSRFTSNVQTTLARAPPTPPSAKVIIQPPTPPDANRKSSPPLVSSSQAGTSDVSSGSGSETLEMLAPKSRRARIHQRGVLPSTIRPPEQSTPVPAISKVKADKDICIPFPVDDLEATPRAFTSIVAPKPVAPLTIASVTSDVLSRPVSVGAIGRKKSGEPLKSSLKSRRPVVRGDLSVVTGLPSSISEPTTPTGLKSVHFDSQLEHVKLFLAEQKPLAVSRDGSPTDDTSGTESDFPTFIYGKEEKTEKSVLEVVTTGLRAETAVERERTDVKLEDLQLGEDGTSIVGRIRVKNISFEKWLAVRFTCDWWQTTSEVTAKYLESVPGTDGQHDRFHFTIKLNDMLSRIEEKTMFLAIRYAAAGREMWDNNAGQNYKVAFAMRKVQVTTQKTIDESGRATGIAVLKSKLEKVAQDDENRSTVGGFLSSRSQRSHSLSPPVAVAVASPKLPSRVSTERQGFVLNSNTSLSSRYDFGASLKSNWRRTASLESPAGTIPEHSRTKTHPATIPHFPRRTPADKRTMVELTRGSPRMFDNETTASIPSGSYVPSHLEDSSASPSFRKASRNHQRGYFDLGVTSSASGVRRTPPGSPFGLPGIGGSPLSSGRNSPAPLTQEVQEASMMWRVASGGSEDSTPSSSAANEESSRDSSPNTSPYEGPLTLAADDSLPRSPSSDDQSSYSAFLNK